MFEEAPLIKHWTNYCQRKLKNKNWYPWIFKSAIGGLMCVGAECPLITRGPNKGKPNYKRANPATRETVIIPANKIVRKK